MTESVICRLSFTMTGVGIEKWNQLVELGLPTTRTKKPARQVLTSCAGFSTCMVWPWVHIACVITTASLPPIVENGNASGGAAVSREGGSITPNGQLLPRASFLGRLLRSVKAWFRRGVIYFF
ncbi:hypothetical protein OOK29_37015 [Streptomyces phaeochromogenes]|nr:hypothetical protein [Streptomyces phaeochromogenes]